MTLYKQKSPLLIFCLLMLVSTYGCGQESPVLKTVDKTICQQEMTQTDFRILDVRTPEEYQKGHISGAENINFYADNFKSQLEKMDKSTKTIIYCAAGGRSHKALKIMEEMGFTYVLELKNGYDEWIKE